MNALRMRLYMISIELFFNFADKIKKEIAMDLFEFCFDIDFVMDVTGLDFISVNKILIKKIKNDISNFKRQKKYI